MAQTGKIKQGDDKQKDARFEKQEKVPFLKIDWRGDIFSNFIANFRRNFNGSKLGSGLGKLFASNSLGKSKQETPPDIMGKSASIAELLTGTKPPKQSFNAAREMNVPHRAQSQQSKNAPVTVRKRKMGL